MPPAPECQAMYPTPGLPGSSVGVEVLERATALLHRLLGGRAESRTTKAAKTNNGPSLAKLPHQPSCTAESALHSGGSAPFIHVRQARTSMIWTVQGSFELGRSQLPKKAQLQAPPTNI